MAWLLPLFFVLGCVGDPLQPTTIPPDCRGTLDRTIAVDCAYHAVPRHHDDPHGPALQLYVHHIAAPQKRSGQLWLLSGGPGQAGSTFLYPNGEIDAVRAALPGLDIYVPDHRGTGESAGLFCPPPAPTDVDDVAFAKKCLANAEATQGNLDAFTATEAARDLEQLIREERRGDEPVFVWGVSYGTYWAHRYLQIAPAQASAVILESLALDDDWSSYDSDANREAQLLFSKCGADAFCSAKLGSDPWSRLTALDQKLAGGFCATLGGQAKFHDLLGSVSSFWPTWLPMVVYRAERCSDDDLKVIGRLSSKFRSYEEVGFSGILQANIILSEIWPRPGPSLADATAAESQLLVAPGLVPDLARLAPWWPLYPRDQYVGKWATPQMPLLLLSDTLDFHTAERNMDSEAAHFPQAQYVVVPNAEHAPSWRPGCAQTLATAFLANPSAALDTSCVATAPPPDFSIPGARQVLGVDDAWEGAAPLER